MKQTVANYEVADPSGEGPAIKMRAQIYQDGAWIAELNCTDYSESVGEYGTQGEAAEAAVAAAAEEAIGEVTREEYVSIS